MDFLTFLEKASPIIGYLSFVVSVVLTIYLIREHKQKETNIAADTEKIKADTAKTFQDMLDKEMEKGQRMRNTIETLRCKIDKLELEVEKLKKDLEARDVGISILINQILNRGEKPDWQPTEEE